MQLRLLMCIVSIATAVVTAAPARSEEGDFESLIQKLPASPNVLVLLNAEKIFDSEIATLEGWKQQYEARFTDAPLLLPPTARQFVLAVDLDLLHLQPRWQAAVMRLSSDPSTALIAKTIHGQSDTLAGFEVVTTPKNAMIVKFAPHIFGLRQPGDRQAIGRWIQETQHRSIDRLSPYLQSGAAVPDRVGTEIIMAIDLYNALSPNRVLEAMNASKIIQESSLDPKTSAEILTSIKGLTLGARVTKRVHGVLRIDFEQDVSPLADMAKPLFLETLANAGASIDEFADWEVEIETTRISLEGELTHSGLRRLFSFLELDGTVLEEAKTEDTSVDPAMEPAVDAYASLEYFQSVTRYLNDLKRERGASSYYTIAVWFDKYARRIDRLPILRVDKDLVDYGQRTVSQLRNAVEAIRGAGIRSGARSAQVTSGDAGYSYDGYGYPAYALFSHASQADIAAAQVGAVEQERRAIRAEEQGQSSTDVRAIVRQLEEETSVIRRQMTERYNIEFKESSRRPAS